MNCFPILFVLKVAHQACNLVFPSFLNEHHSLLISLTCILLVGSVVATAESAIICCNAIYVLLVPSNRYIVCGPGNLIITFLLVDT